jgi:hypothetical protein
MRIQTKGHERLQRYNKYDLLVSVTRAVQSSSVVHWTLLVRVQLVRDVRLRGHRTGRRVSSWYFVTRYGYMSSYGLRVRFTATVYRYGLWV